MGISVPSRPRSNRSKYIPRHAGRRRNHLAAMAPGRAARIGIAASAVAATALTGAQLQAPAASQAAQQDVVRVSDAQRESDAQRLLDGINAYRSSHGLQPVKYSARLTQIEQQHSDDQVVAESFYHTDDFLTDARAGHYTHANEVIALSYQRDVLQLLAWWKTSPAHNAALLNPNAQVIGIALTYADGSLSHTGQPWQLLGTVNLYGYSTGGAPSDASTTVSGGAKPQGNGSFSVYGAIGSAYDDNGGTGAFGAPTMSESTATGGRYQIFQDGQGRRYKFLWSQTTGANWVKEFGAIGTTWSRNGYERGFGFPTTNEYRYGQEVRQNFSNGYVLGWNVNDGNVRVYR